MNDDFKRAIEAEYERFLRDELEHVVDGYRNNLKSEVHELLSEVESPIEAKLAIALYSCAETKDFNVYTEQRKEFFMGFPSGLQICPQYELFGYRADFAIFERHVFGEETKIIVECDGHDFHERTKEQARRDRQRDRDLSYNGWRVLRFTGSEIHENAEGCADSIFMFVESDSIADYMRANT